MSIFGRPDSDRKTAGMPDSKKVSAEPRATIGGGEYRRDAEMASTDEVRIPLVEEQLAVGKREIETGRVHVRTHVEEEQVTLTETLQRDVVDVERVPMGIEVQTAPAPFEDDDGTYVVPIVEERLVVEKRLFVVEELRIRRRHTSGPVEIPATRRVMRADIERDGPDQLSTSPTMTAGDRGANRDQGMISTEGNT